MIEVESAQGLPLECGSIRLEGFRIRKIIHADRQRLAFLYLEGLKEQSAQQLEVMQ